MPGSPFVKLASDYLLLMCRLIFVGTLREIPPGSALSVFNIYEKDEKTGILMTKVAGTRSPAP